MIVVGVIVTDANRHIVWMNPMVSEFLAVVDGITHATKILARGSSAHQHVRVYET